MNPSDSNINQVPGIPCRCHWNPYGPTTGHTSERCHNNATQEDGLCDWCASDDARTEDQLRANPKALVMPDGEYAGIGGAGEFHDARYTDTVPPKPYKMPTACWYPDSDRVLADDSLISRDLPGSLQ